MRSMYVEYELLWTVGGMWLINLVAMYWIWEDSQAHKRRAWPWIFILMLGDPFSTYVSNHYRYEYLPSKGIYPYLVPFFRYDSTHFLEPVWILDTFFFWSILFSLIDSTIAFFIIYWIYSDCKKTGERATPWISISRFIQVMPFPINYFFPLSGYTGQIFILAGYILYKLGYFRRRQI